MKSCVLVHPDELSDRWIERAAACGADTIGLHPVGGPVAAQSLQELAELLKTEEYRGLLDRARARGLEIIYQMHAAGWLLPRDEFATSPQLFRIDEEGRRNSDCNFCVSNKTALNTVAQRAGELAGLLYASAPRFYFWSDDVFGKKCRCRDCDGLSASDQQLLTVNAMLAEIRKSIPDAKMAYLAYYDCLVPPAKVKPAEGVFLEYAPIEKYRIGKGGSRELAEAEAAQLAPLLEYFGRENSEVLEYWLDNSLYSDWTKPPKKFTADGNAISEDISRYRKLGFENITTFACYLGPDYEALHGQPDISAFGAACDAAR